MRITRDGLIAGFPAFDMRALIRRCTPNPRSGTRLWWLAEAIGGDMTLARQMVDALVEHGYLAPYHDEVENEPDLWTRTSLGNTLANASAARPFKRATAETALEALLARAAAINANAELLCAVSEIVVFGSYLTDATELGDVDVAISYHAKPNMTVEAHLARARQSGRHFPTYLDMLMWGYTEVQLLIKNRSRTLSIHEMDDGALRSGLVRLIFEADSPEPAIRCLREYAAVGARMAQAAARESGPGVVLAIVPPDGIGMPHFHYRPFDAGDYPDNPEAAQFFREFYREYDTERLWHLCAIRMGEPGIFASWRLSTGPDMAITRSLAVWDRERRQAEARFRQKGIWGHIARDQEIPGVS